MSTTVDDLEALRVLREQRLRTTVNLCGLAHPFYRKKFASVGLIPGDINTLDDLEKLPLTRKSDYMADPEAFRLHAVDLPNASIEEKTLWNIAYTTGTTSGTPSPFFNTTHDQYTIMLQAQRCAEIEGFKKTDVLANLIPLPPMPTGGFLVVNRTAEVLGIPVMNALTGARKAEYPVHRGLDEAIEVVAAARPAILLGIPSFLRRFFRRARERNIVFAGARMIVTTGEPVSENLQREFSGYLEEQGTTDPLVRLRYSFAEMQGGLIQARNNGVPQNVTPDIYYLEVVDPDTGRRQPEGQEGALALTHLHRRGTVFLRYLVGDVAAFRLERCADSGVLGERLTQRPRRADDLVKVKGMLVNPALVLDILSAERSIQEFQLVVRKIDIDDMDSPDILEVRIAADETQQARLLATIPDSVQRAIMVRPQVSFVSASDIFDPAKNLKARRFVDARPVGGRRDYETARTA